MTFQLLKMNKLFRKRCIMSKTANRCAKNSKYRENCKQVMLKKMNLDLMKVSSKKTNFNC